MNILLATMSMGVGGAETHIIEMSKELINRGHLVTVAAANGELVKELISVGASFVNLPLNKKDPISFHKSFKGLENLIKSKNFDIVHAHARIPAFYCSILCEKYDVRFVTTAHFKFSTLPMWKYLSSWGEKTFSVSEDISKYLIENYHVYRDNIYNIPNGIDFDKFKYNSELRKETRSQLGAGKRKVILNVSRLSKPASICSLKILEAAKLLLSESQDYLFLFVGDGEDYLYLSEEACAINEKYGKTLVMFLGEKTNVLPYICASDVYVGPSRSALEAISVGIPTVVCSSNGYIGEVVEENYDILEKTNLCCGGCEESSTYNILNGIKSILSKNKNELLSLITSQSVFIQRYSVPKMVDIYENVYNELVDLSISKKADALICGYYGFGNVGDEAMLSSLVKEIRKNDKSINVCVMSSNKKNTKNEHLVQTINRKNIFSIIKKLKESKLLILGGGNLIQDKTSNRSLMYYLMIIKLASLLKAKIVIYANGFGPLKKSKIPRVVKALKLADYVSVREESSYAFCRTHQINAVRAADPVFLNSFDSYEKFDSNYFVCIPHGIKNDEIDKVCLNLKALKIKLDLKPVIVSLHDSQDAKLCKQMADELKGDCLLISKQGFGTLKDIIGSSAFVITSRYHAVICAAMTNQIVVSMGDSKMESIMKELGIDDFMFKSYDDIQHSVNYAMTHNRIIRTKYQSEIKRLSDLSKVDVQNIICIINGNKENTREDLKVSKSIFDD